MATNFSHLYHQKNSKECVVQVTILLMGHAATTSSPSRFLIFDCLLIKIFSLQFYVTTSVLILLIHSAMSISLSREKFTLHRPISIVLEGLDGVGKSTIAEELAVCLHARCLQTPPGIIKDFRGYFDSQDVPTRNAYYMIGNFLAGNEFLKFVAEGESVVVDRYYGSTIAYRTGKNLPDTELPPTDDPVYSWPKELPKPDYMFLLTLPEKDRLIRRASRLTVEETIEEKRIRMEPKISERINEVYRRLGCIEIQLVATDNIDDVIQKIVAELSNEIKPEKIGLSKIP